MPITIEEGWQVLGRTKSGELHPCYFCSRDTPKFHVGWRVQLIDGKTITVGPVCGRTHLGDRFTIDKRAIEEAEELANLEARRTAWLALRSQVESAATATLEDEGIARLVAIKERTLNMAPVAMKHLAAIGAGIVPSVPRLRIFEHGSPRQDARVVLRCLERLASPGTLERRDLVSILRELEQTIASHNDSVSHYAEGMVAFTEPMLRRINEALPALEWTVSDGQLQIRRRNDRLTDRLPLPESLNLKNYPVPR